MHLINILRKLSRGHYLMLSVFWTLLILILSLMSAGSMPTFSFMQLVGIDKIGHLIFYLVLTFLWLGTIRPNGNVKSFFLLFFLLSFGVLIEFLQLYLSNGRMFEYGDVLANFVGVFIGAIIFKNFIN